MEDIDARLMKIEERNARVEADKAWENNWIRKISIAILTYLLVCLFLYIIHESDIFIKALVPVLGYLISTATLRIIRKIVQ